jgi:hypothetical protein
LGLVVALLNSAGVVGGGEVVVVFAMVSIEFESVCELEIMTTMNCVVVLLGRELKWIFNTYQIIRKLELIDRKLLAFAQNSMHALELGVGAMCTDLILCITRTAYWYLICSRDHDRADFGECRTKPKRSILFHRTVSHR